MADAPIELSINIFPILISFAFVKMFANLWIAPYAPSNIDANIPKIDIRLTLICSVLFSILSNFPSTSLNFVSKFNTLFSKSEVLI